MTGRPTVQVLLDDGTGTFPHDVTAYARQSDGFSFNRGRPDEHSGPVAGQLNLVFNNADGRFTRGSTLIDSPSPIVVDQRIRIKETINGNTYTRFTGYVKAWPVSWPGGGGGAHSEVRIFASCAQARAGRRPLRSVVEEEFALDSPDPHYPLGEPEGATSAADSSGNQAPALTMAGTGTAVTFSGAVATFSNGKWLTNTFSEMTVAAMECEFTTTTNGAFILAGRSAALTLGTGITGDLQAAGPGLGILTSGVSVADGERHTAAIRYDGATAHLVLDGAVVDTAATALAGADITGLDVGFGMVGSVSQVALFSTDPGATRIADHAEAMLTGFDGESGTDRITRIAGYAGIPLGTLDTSLTNVPAKDIAGTSAWSAIEEVTAAEGGLSVVDGSGNLIFLNRNDPVGKATPDVTISAAFVPPDVEPVDDDAEIINYFEATAEGTGVAQVVRDATSEDAHGRYPESKTYLVTTDAEALDRANWIVSTQAEPSTRYGSLPINLLNMSAAQQEAAIAGLEPGAWLRITGMNSQTPDSTTVDVMVQGFTEKLTANEWSLTLNVVARERYDGVWILGTSALGVDTKLYF